MSDPNPSYVGRLAPTPTGLLHAGHARTFHAAWRRAREANGTICLRVEDLDPERCKAEFTDCMLEDLSWLGLDWDEGPVFQSRRKQLFHRMWSRLKECGWIYPSTVSRKEIRNVARAPHDDEEQAEQVFPPELRTRPGEEKIFNSPAGVNWRFRVPDGKEIRFVDERCGEQCFKAGVDFGDFVVWRRDNVPAYELAVVADDVDMGITEVVRGEDLLKSTARQILIYQALDLHPPKWCHEGLLRDADGKRLAKRCGSCSIRELRERGLSPEEVICGEFPL